MLLRNAGAWGLFAKGKTQLGERIEGRCLIECDIQEDVLVTLQFSVALKTQAGPEASIELESERFASIVTTETIDV